MYFISIFILFYFLLFFLWTCLEFISDSFTVSRHFHKRACTTNHTQQWGRWGVSRNSCPRPPSLLSWSLHRGNCCFFDASASLELFLLPMRTFFVVLYLSYLFTHFFLLSVAQLLAQINWTDWGLYKGMVDLFCEIQEKTKNNKTINKSKK